jgi:hypothetical protein
MEMMRMRSIAEPEVLVSGRRLGLSLMAGILSAAGVGIITYYGLAKILGGLLGTALPQIVTFAVYATTYWVLQLRMVIVGERCDLTNNFNQ